MPVLPCFRALALAGCLAIAAPSVAADPVEAVVAAALAALPQGDAPDQRDAALRTLLLQGGQAVPELTRRLAAPGNDAERLQITYLLGLLYAQARVKAAPIDTPSELIPAMAAALDATESLRLRANLANLAGNLARQGVDTTALVPALLSVLARTGNPGLRATTSAVISTAPAALPVIHAALRQSTDDRFRGDLARILRGTPLPDDVVADLKSLVASDHREARQAAARTLRQAGIRDPQLLEAALRDLAAARTDMEILFAVTAVRENNDGSAHTASALREAMDKARRIEERREIAVALAEMGEVGRTTLLDYLAQTQNAQVAADLTMTLTSDMREDPRTLGVLVGLMARMDDERLNRLVEIRLFEHPARARAAIDAALAANDLDAAARERLTGMLRALPG